VSGLVINSGTVTFDVSWNKPTTSLWSDTVWVFVDHNVAGTMMRLPLIAGATLTSNMAPGVGRVIEEPNNDQGVWVVGNARSAGTFSATVQLLTNKPNVARACVYGSAYPPVGRYTSTTRISFVGTPNYNIVINSGGATSTIVSGGTYEAPPGGYVQSFTDRTGAPGLLVPATYTLSGVDYAGAGATLTLSGSQKGWKYQLYKDAMPVGAIVDGTGGALNFPDASAAGTYSYTVWTVSNAAVKAQRAMQVSNVHEITVNLLSVGASYGRGALR
jgi:hypothetical protein